MKVPTESWADAVGEDLFSSVRGVSYSKADAKNQPGRDLVPILRANNISEGEIVIDDLVYVPSHYVSADQFLKDGDILIAASSGSRSVVGKAARATSTHEKFAFGAFCTVARPRLPEFGQWLSEYVRTRAYRTYVEGVALGININNLRGTDLKAMPISIAPLLEQRRIVAKIDSLSSKSKHARKQLDHVPRLVEKYKQAVLARAFRGELTNIWRSRHTMALDPENRGVVTDREVNSLYSVPSTWHWRPAGQIAEIGGGLTKNAKRGEIASQRHYLRVANVYANELRLEDVALIGCTDREFEKMKLRSGDLLIVEGNGSIDQIGRVAVWNNEIADCIHQNHLIRLRPSANMVPRYCLYWLLSPIGREQIELVASSSSGLHTLSISKVEKLPVPICSKLEQEEIVRHVERAFTWIEDLAAEAGSAHKLVDHLDQAILAKAFRGELVLQDPNDEPANALLDRIRAKQEAAQSKIKRRGRKSPS